MSLEIRSRDSFPLHRFSTGDRAISNRGRSETSSFASPPRDGFAIDSRSEERRVGKECGYLWVTVQAEDGIRDWSVTGVQTCALPISTAASMTVRLSSAWK